MLFVVGWLLLLVVRRVSFAVLLLVGCCLVRIRRCLLPGVCCVLFVVCLCCCLAFECCLLCFVA